MVQNAAARLISGARRADHITPILRDLHWLPVRQRVTYKIAMTVYKCMSARPWTSVSCGRLSLRYWRPSWTAFIDRLTSAADSAHQYYVWRQSVFCRWSSCLERSSRRLARSFTERTDILWTVENVLVCLTAAHLMFKVRLINALYHYHYHYHYQLLFATPLLIATTFTMFCRKDVSKLCSRDKILPRQNDAFSLIVPRVPGIFPTVYVESAPLTAGLVRNSIDT